MANRRWQNQPVSGRWPASAGWRTAELRPPRLDSSVEYPKEMNQVDILHRYGARRHYLPIEAAFGEVPNPNVEYYEFTFTTDLARAPRNASYLFDVLTGRRERRPIVLGAEPYDARLPLFCQISDNYPVVYHTSWPYWSNGPVPRRPVHSGLPDAWINFLKTVPVVTVTTTARDALADRGVEAMHIPHAVDVATYSPSAGQVSDKRELLFVGRLEERKGVDLLLQLSRDLDDTTIRFVGDGPMRDRIEEHSQRENVVYEGYVSDDDRLASLYASADVFVLPSRPADTWEELFGIVLIEAMACGTPVVSTTCVGPAEVVDDEATGLLVEPNDYDGLREAVQRLFEDPELRRRMSERARQEAETKYALDVVSKAWLNILQSVA